MPTRTLTASGSPTLSNTVEGMVGGVLARAADVNAALQTLIDNDAALEETVADAIPKAVITAADQLVYGTASATPAVLTVAASRIVGKKASGTVGALTGTEARVVLGLATTDDVSFNKMTSTVATGTAPLVVASTTEVANLNASRVAGRVPGAVSGVPTLDASTKVVENPASAQTTAAASKIPISGADGTIAPNYLATGTVSAGKVPMGQADGSIVWMSPPSGNAGIDDADMAYDSDASYGYLDPQGITGYGVVSF